MKNILIGLVVIGSIAGIIAILYDLLGEHFFENIGWNILFIFPIMGVSYIIGRNKKVKRFLNVE